MEDLEIICKKLKKKLKKERYQHTMGVMYTAASLAMRYDTDVNAALTAGLLHDCGKYPSIDKQMKSCGKYGVILTEDELKIPALIHSRLGACLAEKKYGVEDKDILNAILYHTTGRPDMSLLEKIIYLADYIEPGRKMIPGLTEIRKLSFTDIDGAVRLCAENTLKYLEKSGRFIDPMTKRTYEYYQKQCNLNQP